MKRSSIIPPDTAGAGLVNGQITPRCEETSLASQVGLSPGLRRKTDSRQRPARYPGNRAHRTTLRPMWKRAVQLNGDCAWAWAFKMPPNGAGFETTRAAWLGGRAEPKCCPMRNIAHHNLEEGREFVIKVGWVQPSDDPPHMMCLRLVVAGSVTGSKARPSGGFFFAKLLALLKLDKVLFDQAADQRPKPNKYSSRKGKWELEI